MTTGIRDARTDTIEGEVREERALAPVGQVSSTIAVAVGQAEQITRLIDQKNLAVRISGRRHVRVEAWTALAQGNGKRFDVLDLQHLGDPASEEYTVRACVGLRDMATREIEARAWASCSRRERLWKERDAFAIESMAQTRAAGKVARLVYGWVVALAGFEATPAEELSGTEPLGETPPFRLDPADKTAIALAVKGGLSKPQKDAVAAWMTKHGYRGGWSAFFERARSQDDVDEALKLVGARVEFDPDAVAAE